MNAIFTCDECHEEIQLGYHTTDRGVLCADCLENGNSPVSPTAESYVGQVENNPEKFAEALRVLGWVCIPPGGNQIRIATWVYELIEDAQVGNTSDAKRIYNILSSVDEISTVEDLVEKVRNERVLVYRNFGRKSYHVLKKALKEKGYWPT